MSPGRPLSRGLDEADFERLSRGVVVGLSRIEVVAFSAGDDPSWPGLWILAQIIARELTDQSEVTSASEHGWGAEPVEEAKAVQDE